MLVASTIIRSVFPTKRNRYAGAAHLRRRIRSASSDAKTHPCVRRLVAGLAATLIALLLGRVAPAFAGDIVPLPQEKLTPVDAWTAVARMTPGINIGNTLENTAQWETGWGNPPITKQYVEHLAKLGFKSVRLPVAWDTYADDGHITPEQFRRVAEVVNWITDAGMYCVINIHWDGGWINSGWKERFPTTYNTFSPEAEKKFVSYWTQIARFFGGKNEKLIFEGFSEESFDNEPKPYEAQNRVNQVFIDTVRATGGNNASRLLLVAGYSADITKTCKSDFKMPRDTVRGKVFISIHYYTPWTFVGLSEDANWGKMMPTWGTADDVKQLNELFDSLDGFCQRNNVPAYIGEFSMCSKKEQASAVRWTTAVAEAALKRKMVPVIWDTGGGIARREPFTMGRVLAQTLSNIGYAPPAATSSGQ